MSARPAICALAALLGLGAGPSVPAREPQASLLGAINQARGRGCDGRPGQPPLAPEPRLQRAAERLGRGQDLEAALAAEGYRAQQAGMVSLRGYPGAAGLAEGMARHSCARLQEASWRHVGIFQQGDRGWVILAVPFTPPQPQDAAQVRAEMLQLVNQARAQPRRCGSQAFDSAPPLRLDARLHRAAELHAADMARHGYFSHTGRDGSQVADRAGRSGYDWRRIGENLAAGQATPAAAVQGWLASPGHCANLMQPAFTDMGLAFAVNLQGREGIHWVQVLGQPR